MYPEIWGPHYWFFLHTIAYTYPNCPNAVTKRKYYDLIQNFPLFLPDESIGDTFVELLDKYPVTPYLDKRESFMRWVHFIHNKINRSLGKQTDPFLDSVQKYEEIYRPQTMVHSDYANLKKEVIMICFIVLLATIAFMYV
jgi:hypothetical protein